MKDIIEYFEKMKCLKVYSLVFSLSLLLSSTKLFVHLPFIYLYSSFIFGFRYLVILAFNFFYSCLLAFALLLIACLHSVLEWSSSFQQIKYNYSNLFQFNFQSFISFITLFFRAKKNKATYLSFQWKLWGGCHLLPGFVRVIVIVKTPPLHQLN